MNDQKEFSRAVIASFIASITKSVTAFLDDIEAKDHVPTEQPREAQPSDSRLAHRLFSEAVEQNLDHWESHVLEKAPPWLLEEFRDIRWMLKETVRHQLHGTS